MNLCVDCLFILGGDTGIWVDAYATNIYIRRVPE